MPNYHRRCVYMDERGMQCETWFPLKDSNEKMCAPHSQIAAPNGHTEQVVKYIDLANKERALCHKMTDEELDEHISGLEKIIEEQKALVQNARAVRLDRFDKMTEEERAERRKIKIERAANQNQSQKLSPTEKLIQKGNFKNITKDIANDMLSMDPDEFLKKFAEAKAKKGG